MTVLVIVDSGYSKWTYFLIFIFQDWAFFAVFDGHAGAKISAHCSEHLLNSITSGEEFLVRELVLYCGTTFCKKGHGSSLICEENLKVYRVKAHY